MDVSKISTPISVHAGKREHEAEDNRAKKRKGGDQEHSNAEENIPNIPCNKV